MPKVEQYGGLKVSSAVGRVGQARAPMVADNYSAVTKGVGSLVSGLGELDDSIKTAEGDAALIAFERETNDLFYNEDTGYYASQGKNAYDGLDPTKERYQKSYDKHFGELSQGAKNKVEARFGNMMTSETARMSLHAGKGFKQYEQALDVDKTENALERARHLYNSPKDIDEIARELITLAEKSKAAAGEDATEAKQNAVSSVVNSSVNAAIEQGDIATARDLVSRFDTMMGAEGGMVEINKKIDSAEFDVVTAQQSARIVGNGGRALSAMMADVRSMPTDTPNEVAMKNEVMRSVKNEYAIQKILNDAAKEEQFNNLATEVENGGKYNSIPQATRDAMTASERASLKTIESAISKGNLPESNSPLYHQLIRDLSDNPESAREFKAEQYSDRIPAAELKKLSAVAQSTKNNIASTKEADIQYKKSEMAQSVTDSLLGYKTNAKKNDAFREKERMLGRAMNKAIAARQEALGKGTLTVEEHQDAIQSFLHEEVLKGFTLGPLTLTTNKVNISELSPEELDAMSIISSLNPNANAASPEDILGLYRELSDADQLEGIMEEYEAGTLQQTFSSAFGDN
jgi:hypothetical protein